MHDAPRRQKPPPPGTRPAPLVEVRPQTGCERHCGSGFELVLEVTVPQFGRELVEVPNVVSQVNEQNVGSSWWWAVSLPVGGLQGSRPGQGSIVHAIPALAVEHVHPAPAVSRSSAPVVESIAPRASGVRIGSTRSSRTSSTNASD